MSIGCDECGARYDEQGSLWHRFGCTRGVNVTRLPTRPGSHGAMLELLEDSKARVEAAPDTVGVIVIIVSAEHDTLLGFTGGSSLVMLGALAKATDAILGEEEED